MGQKSQKTKPRVYETLLFIALLSGPPAFRMRDPTASLSGVVDWSILLNAAVWALGAFWVFLHLGGYVLKERSMPRPGPLHVLALLLVFCLYLSTFTSLAPPLTFYRVSQVLITMLFGFFWVRRFGIDSTLKHLLAGLVVVCLMIGVAWIVAPGLVGDAAGDPRYARPGIRGDAIANTGAVTAMGLIIALSYPVVKVRLVYLSIVVLMAAFLVASMTRAAYAVALAFFLLALLRLPRSNPLRLSLYFLSILVPLVLLSQWAPAVLAYVTRGGSKLSTFSDRIPLWQYTISETLERSPWTGVGFYANREITSSYNEGLGTSHSAYLEVFSGGGILSSSVFIVMLLVELFLVSKLFLLHGGKPEAFTVVGLFFATALIGVTSEEMVINSPTSFTFWMLLTLIPAVTQTMQSRARGGEIGAGQNGSQGT